MILFVSLVVICLSVGLLCCFVGFACAVYCGGVICACNTILQARFLGCVCC